MSYYFVIVGNKDQPIYEAEFGFRELHSNTKNDDYKHLNQFIVHGSLDLVDEAIWSTKDCYLRSVDKFNDWFISSYVLPSQIKLLLLHNTHHDDPIKNFFLEVHELYVKVLLNIFYEVDSKITCPVFESKVRSAAKRHL